MKDADGVIITYDVTSRKSFDRVNFWRRTVESCDTIRPNIVYILVGNKCDLKDHRAVVTGEGLTEASKTFSHSNSQANLAFPSIQTMPHQVISVVHSSHNSVIYEKCNATS